MTSVVLIYEASPNAMSALWKVAGFDQAVLALCCRSEAATLADYRPRLQLLVLCWTMVRFLRDNCGTRSTSVETIPQMECWIVGYGEISSLSHKLIG